MSKKLKIGIIGAGTIGKTHMRAIKESGVSEVAAICDPDAKILEAAGNEYGVAPRYPSAKAMLKKASLDAVVVATPNSVHCPEAVAAFKAGMHVLCEKPTALNAAEARKMVAAANKADKILQIGMVVRYDGESMLAKEYIEDGLLGRIYHMHLILRRRRGIPGLGGWFTTHEHSGGGALIDCGVHYLDLLMWLSDSWNPQRVSASLYSKFGPRMKNYLYHGKMWAGPPNYKGTFNVDDYAGGMIRFADNKTLTFEVSWAANCKQENYVELLGDKGGMRLHDGNAPVLYTEHNNHVADIHPQFEKKDGFVAQHQAFAKAVTGKTPCIVPGEQGVALMSVIDAIHKSSEQNKEVAVRLS
jgi:predicted dehydrogenase